MKLAAIGKLYLFFLPALVIILIFFAIPAVTTAIMGFTNMDFQFKWNFIGFGNYVKMVKDFLIWPIWREGKLARPNIIINTAIWVFATLLINTIFGLILAILTTSIERRAGTFFRAIWLLPRFTPMIVYGVICLSLLLPTKRGIFNAVRGAVGLQPLDWISLYPMAVVIITGGFIGASMGMVILASAIDSISEDLRRAAKVDGASWFQEIRYIILPLIRWPLMFITAYQTLSLLTSYESILVITKGGPFFASTNWSLYAYKAAFDVYSGTYAYGYGAALATILVIIGIIFSIAYWRIFKFKEMMSEPKIEVE